MNWLIGIALLVTIGYLLDREIYFYEGVHLGSHVQGWLYDRWSRKYDEGKHESQLRDEEMLARPILDATKHLPTPFILDFATGTGRLAYALVSRPEFNGRILALDLSKGMLKQAAKKMAGPDTPSADRPAKHVEFLRHQALPLPFPDASFDVVCALEVLELFPTMNEPLSEFARILRPGGVFLASRGTEESGRTAKVKSVAVFTSLLENNGFEQIHIVQWWKLFDRVLAIKKGSSDPVKNHGLQNVLQCSACGQIQWERKTDSLLCGNCGTELTITSDGIVLH